MLANGTLALMCTLEHLDWLICRYLSKEVCFVIRCNLWTNRLAAMWLLARYWGLLFGLGQVFVLLFHDFNFIQVLFQGEFWRLDMLEPNFFELENCAGHWGLQVFQGASKSIKIKERWMLELGSKMALIHPVKLVRLFPYWVQFFEGRKKFWWSLALDIGDLSFLGVFSRH